MSDLLNIFKHVHKVSAEQLKDTLQNSQEDFRQSFLSSLPWDTPKTINKLSILVVYNEHTLGYLHPDRPQYLYVIHSSPYRGALSSSTVRILSPKDFLRLASPLDFKSFHVSFSGYDNPELYYYNKI